MKLSLKCLKVGLSSFVVTGMLILPTGVFATDGGGDLGSKLGEVIHQVDTKLDKGHDSDEVKAHAKADLVVVTPLAGKVDGKLQFQCVNHGSELVTMKYAVKGSDEKKEVTLAPNETKMIEIDSVDEALIDLWVNEIAKASVKAYTGATASVKNKADLIFVKALAAKADGKIRYQFENRNNEPITVKYAWVGSDLKQDVTLSANEKKVIELDSAGKASLGLWVNEVAKTPVQAFVATTASSEVKADWVSVRPLVASVDGKLRFLLLNNGYEPITVKYALAGSDNNQEIDLAASEIKVIELDSAPGNASLNVWVNEVAKAPVAAIAANISPQTEVDLVVVEALPVKEVGKIRFQLANTNASPVTVKYELAGSDLKKEIDLAANETAIIEIETAKDKASLDLWVNEVAKTPVEANIDLTVLNPNLNLGNDTDTNPGANTGTTPGNGTGTSPDTGTVGGVSTGGNTDNGSVAPLPVVSPDSQNAAADANGNQPGSGTLVAGVSDSPGAVAGYDQLPQTGEQVPWINYLIGSVMVLLGALTLTKLRRRTH